MITKCDHPGCTKAGTCRAPKNRDLREYWHFCPEHAAEYNKNWNYYADMTHDEINDEWERETFGIADKDIKQANKNKQEFSKKFYVGDITNKTKAINTSLDTISLTFCVKSINPCMVFSLFSCYLFYSNS